jgi:hypothetical protein
MTKYKEKFEKLLLKIQFSFKNTNHALARHSRALQRQGIEIMLQAG